MKCSLLKNQYVCRPIKEAEPVSPQLSQSQCRGRVAVSSGSPWCLPERIWNQFKLSLMLRWRISFGETVGPGVQLAFNPGPQFHCYRQYERKVGRNFTLELEGCGLGNISKILFRPDCWTNFCRSIYRFQPATVQSPEAESLYSEEKKPIWSILLSSRCSNFLKMAQNWAQNGNSILNWAPQWEFNPEDSDSCAKEVHIQKIRLYRVIYFTGTPPKSVSR